ncbi:TlpA family protein disulfide reductase [Flavobacterium silvisoli]|uniref:TlpA family protein disulfide reductase n=1 Tax=Flavobacterium silvisoli TaxID=2529433 RepID=A0A4V2L5C5_9FLAO|nr:TlpA disulfide reductase family protein [Flavobacterium silvisoli]TBX70005.1 TlpA family protein disulfide reductase [Flavobacterium silvisoli]
MKKIAVILVVIMIAFAFSTFQKESFSKESLDQKLITPENTEITFKEILKKHHGKPTVIEIWASWCGDCVKAMPKVKEMQAANPNVDYVFISMDKAFDKWHSGIAKHELKGDHYWATGGMKGTFGKSIDLDWIPRYIVLDGKGKIQIYRAIETDFDKINKTLKNLQ